MDVTRSRRGIDRSARRRKDVEHSGAAGEAMGEFGYYVFYYVFGAWAKKTARTLLLVPGGQ